MNKQATFRLNSKEQSINHEMGPYGTDESKLCHTSYQMHL